MPLHLAVRITLDHRKHLMPTARFYKRGLDFPHEGFVQLSIEEHFRKAGFHLTVDGRIDLLCSHPATGESWHIEAKGKTTQVGLDFRTGLGQLLQSMHNQETKHGIAVPDIPVFQTQVAKVSEWIVSTLGIHWLFVSQDGSVRVVAPGGPRNSFESNQLRGSAQFRL